jgi:hypothetical protein
VVKREVILETNQSIGFTLKTLHMLKYSPQFGHFRKFAVDLMSDFPHCMKTGSSEAVYSSQKPHFLRFVILHKNQHTVKGYLNSVTNKLLTKKYCGI